MTVGVLTVNDLCITSAAQPAHGAAGAYASANPHVTHQSRTLNIGCVWICSTLVGALTTQGYKVMYNLCSVPGIREKKGCH